MAIINKIEHKHETTITLGNVISIGQFGQITEKATPGLYDVIKLEHNWNNEKCGSAYLFVHESVDMEVQTILQSIDYIDHAHIADDCYGLFSTTDDSFEALDAAWTTAPADGTGFVADTSSVTVDVYTNKEHTVFLLDADSIYFHSLLWPQWTQMEDQQNIAEHLRGWGIQNDRVMVSYYGKNDEFQLEEATVSSGHRTIDVIIETMLATIERLAVMN